MATKNSKKADSTGQKSVSGLTAAPTKKISIKTAAANTKKPAPKSSPQPQAASPSPKPAATEPADQIILPEVRHWSRLVKLAMTAGVALVIIGGTVMALRLSYSGKIYPGIRVYGVYLGGLDKSAAVNLLGTQISTYDKSSFLLNVGTTAQPIAPTDLGAKFDTTTAVDTAFQVGRSGNPFDQIYQQFRSMLGRNNAELARVSLDATKFSQIYLQINQSLTQPVSNAAFHYDGSTVSSIKQIDGQRVDIASFAQALTDHLAQLDPRNLTVATTVMPAQISSDQLQPLLAPAKAFIASPLVLTGAGHTWTVDQNQIISWLNVAPPSDSSNATISLTSMYPSPVPAPVLSLDQTLVRNYLTSLAGQVDVAAVDAQLTISGGQPTVFVPAQNGTTLDVDKSLASITQALETSAVGTNRTIALTITSQKAAIDSDTINQLGITDLLAEGDTTFPGSSSGRLTNIRVGASKFNNVLIKPGEVFSFGAQMGPVTAAQGYVPSLVILNNKEENQYGGGMCQVSTTLFRAALQAGLPINERFPHAFAVSFYTAPFGVQGVDAAIFYPDEDLKFTNDTGHYILIQTHYQGTELKFDLYGTKTKYGVINPPHIVDGSSDPKVASDTVFTRDVFNLSGGLIRTDTFKSHYNSSLDYPVSD